MPEVDPTRRQPVAIVNLDLEIEQIYSSPICDNCTKPEDVLSGDPTRIVAFDTYADLKQHRRDKHPKMKANGKEPHPILDMQISTYESDDEESEMRFMDASDVDIKFWALDLKRYLNTPPNRRDVFPIIGNTRNLRPIDEE